MTRRPVSNLAHSVRQRLLNIARREGTDFNLLLSRYAAERFLYRLSRSKFREHFVLKGAMLFPVWTHTPYRPTRDLDLLGFGDLSAERLREVFETLFALPVEADGLVFDPGSLRISDIRMEEEYLGKKRVLAEAALGKAKVHLQVDIGAGDALVPPAEEITYPVLLELPAPRLMAYAKETVVAEKLQAMVSLGMLNSRMKDFFDLRMLAMEFAFDGARLLDAVRATFRRRGTPLTGELPEAFSEAFVRDPAKQTQWQAFLRNHGLGGKGLSLATCLADNRRFLEPLHRAAGSEEPFKLTWPPGGPWRE